MRSVRQRGMTKRELSRRVAARRPLRPLFAVDGIAQISKQIGSQQRRTLAARICGHRQ